MSDQTEKLVSEITEIVKSSKTFVLDQAPDLAKQIVLSGRIKITLLLIFCLFSFGTLWAFGKFIYKDHKKIGDDSDFIGWCMALSFVVLLLMLLTGGTISDFITVWFAPKLYLLRELK